MKASQDIPLKAKLRKAESSNTTKSYALILPLGIFLLVFFLVPIASMIYRSVDNPLLAKHLPRTSEALKLWDSSKTPDEKTYATFVAELKAVGEKTSIGRIAARLNYDKGGMRSLVVKTARKLKRVSVNTLPPEGTWKKTLAKIDKRWDQPEYWATIKNAGAPITVGYYLAAVDKKLDINGAVVKVPEHKRIYLAIFWRTVWVSALVTSLCFLFGYPIAFLIARVQKKCVNLLLIMVLLPFWTSLLVRTTAWIVMLQREGVVNDLLIFLRLIDEPIQLIYSSFGVLVAMTHVLLPLMILPVYSVMKNISPDYVHAGLSLGATPWTAFWKIYFPQTLPGVGAGALFVFILTLGYYITPALVGGPQDQMISQFIVYHANHSLNWGLASALGTLLLLGVLSGYGLHNKIAKIDTIKLN